MHNSEHHLIVTAVSYNLYFLLSTAVLDHHRTKLAIKQVQYLIFHLWSCVL